MKKNLPTIPPFETMLFGGVLFKVINRHKAHAIIGGLTDFKGEKIYDVFENNWRFPTNEKKAFFLWAEEDVDVEKLELEYSTDEVEDIFILGFIFNRNLTAAHYVMAYDTDNSPALIVLGNLTAPHIHLFGNIHYIAGDVSCELLWGFYNHGELYVKGAAYAWVIYEDDMEMHFGSFGNVTAIVGDRITLNCSLTDTDGKLFFVEGPVWATHRLSDIVLNELIEETEYGIERLRQSEPHDAMAYIKRGDTFIDGSKEAIYEYANFKVEMETAFETIFAYPEMLAQNYLEWREDNTECYWATRYEEDGKWYRKVGKIVFDSKYIAASVKYGEGTTNYELELKHIDLETDKAKYIWNFTVDDDVVEAKSVKFSIRQAIGYLLAIGKYRFTLQNFRKLLATPLIPDGKYSLKVAFLNFGGTISKAIATNKGEQKGDNIYLVNTGNFAWRVSLGKDADHEFLIVEYNANTSDKKMRFSSLADSENADYHKNLKIVWLELMNHIEKKEKAVQ